jgi:hypothetical protein
MSIPPNSLICRVIVSICGHRRPSQELLLGLGLALRAAVADVSGVQRGATLVGASHLIALRCAARKTPARRTRLRRTGRPLRCCSALRASSLVWRSGPLSSEPSDVQTWPAAKSVVAVARRRRAPLRGPPAVCKLGRGGSLRPLFAQLASYWHSDFGRFA